MLNYFMVIIAGSGEKVVKIAFTDEKVCKTNVYQWEEIASSKPFFPSENMITTKSKATVGFHVGGKKWSNDVSTLRIRLLNIDADADVATLLKEIVPKEGYSEVKKIFEFEHSSLRGSAKGYKVVLDGNGGDITASFVVKDFEFQLKIQGMTIKLLSYRRLFLQLEKSHNESYYSYIIFYSSSCDTSAPFMIITITTIIMHIISFWRSTKILLILERTQILSHPNNT